MTTVNMQDAKTQLSQLVARAEAGEEIVVARAGRAAVRLVPVRPLRRRGGFGSMPGLSMAADAILEPLPENELRAWEGET